MNYAFMTTCKARTDKYLKEVQEAIDSIAPQVDKVYLVLSVDEYGDNLPKLSNCTYLLMKKNLYSFKKYIPLYALPQVFDLNDNIFTVDDDWRYHQDYVQYMLNMMGDKDAASLGDGGCIGAFCVFKAKCLQPEFFTKMSQELIDGHIDDIYLTNYFRYKGWKTKYHKGCVDDLVRTVADPLIPESANNPNNSVYPQTFRYAATYKPWGKL